MGNLIGDSQIKLVEGDKILDSITFEDGYKGKE